VRVRVPSEIFDFSQSQNREIKKVPVETFFNFEQTDAQVVGLQCCAYGALPHQYV
jgi:hypothetical protein